MLKRGDAWKRPPFVVKHTTKRSSGPFLVLEKFDETYYFFKSNSLLRSSDIFAIVPGSKILFSPAIVRAS